MAKWNENRKLQLNSKPPSTTFTFMIAQAYRKIGESALEKYRVTQLISKFQWVVMCMIFQVAFVKGANPVIVTRSATGKFVGMETKVEKKTYTKATATVIVSGKEPAAGTAVSLSGDWDTSQEAIAAFDEYIKKFGNASHGPVTLEMPDVWKLVSSTGTLFYSDISGKYAAVRSPEGSQKKQEEEVSLGYVFKEWVGEVPPACEKPQGAPIVSTEEPPNANGSLTTTKTTKTTQNFSWTSYWKAIYTKS